MALTPTNLFNQSTPYNSSQNSLFNQSTQTDLFNQSTELVLYTALQTADVQEQIRSLMTQVGALVNRVWRCPTEPRPNYENRLSPVFDRYKQDIQEVLSSIMPPSDRTLYEARGAKSSPLNLYRLAIDDKLHTLTTKLIKDLKFDLLIEEINQHKEDAPETLNLVVRDFVHYLQKLIPDEHKFTPAYFATHRLISMLYLNLGKSIKNHEALFSHFEELYSYHWNLSSNRAYTNFVIDQQVQYHSYNHMKPLDTFSKAKTPLEQLQERYGLQTLRDWTESLPIQTEGFVAVPPKSFIGCCYGISADLIVRYWAAREAGQSFMEAVGTASEPFAMGATTRAELFQLTALLFHKTPDPDVSLTLALNKIGLDRLELSSNEVKSWEDGTYICLVHYAEKIPNQADHAIAWIVEGKQASLHYPGWGTYIFHDKLEGIDFIEKILGGYPLHGYKGSIDATAMPLKPRAI